MDKVITAFEFHYAHLDRQHPTPTPLACFGRIPDKTYVVNYTFQTWNYSFILSGSGFYFHNGMRHRIEAPAVLHQWPNTPMHYGPDNDWDECYLILPPETGAALTAQNLHPVSQPFWMLQESSKALHLIDELTEMCERKQSIDRIDRVANHLILEGCLAAKVPSESAPEKKITEIRQFLAKHFHQDHNLRYLAEEHGLSYSHFRRLWRTRYQQPPHQFIITSRVQHACQLLVSTNQSIAEIARSVGINDPLYFTRLFRQHRQISPKDYRRHYQRQR